MCALVSARVRENAVFNPSWDIQELSETPSEAFYDAAVRHSTGREVCEPAKTLDALRSFALLCLTAIQYGKMREMQLFLGKYHTVAAMNGIHDETNWPQDIGIVETEERRRLVSPHMMVASLLLQANRYPKVWSMYTLEVYSSIVWNGITRCREQQINVAYTTEIDDDCFSNMAYTQQPVQSPNEITLSPDGQLRNVRSSSWLSGWNFTTDLYRILEHVITNFQDRAPAKKRTPVAGMFKDRSAPSATSVLENIMARYDSLPTCFKTFSEVTCVPSG